MEFQQLNQLTRDRSIVTHYTCYQLRVLAFSTSHCSSKKIRDAYLLVIAVFHIFSIHLNNSITLLKA